MNTLTVISDQPTDTKKIAVRAGARPQAIVPQTMDEVWRIATAVAAAGMAPVGMDTAQKCLVAIMHGLEIGLTPMSSLQRIAVINGRPTIWGDAAIGLVRGSGICEYVKEWIAGEGEKRVAFCEVKRKGEPDSVVRSFSIADARQAGLWEKKGPWLQYPERMLQMRARAFCLRDVFADVLGGLYIREEIEEGNADIEQKPFISHRPIPPAPPAPPAPQVITQAAAQPQAELELTSIQETAQPAEIIQDQKLYKDPEAIIREFEEALAAARDASTVHEAWSDHVEPYLEDIFPSDKAVLQLKRDKKLSDLTRRS